MLSSNMVAIDIGQGKIKLVVGKQVKAGVKLKQAITIDTPSAAYNNGYILKPKEIAEAIKHALGEHNIKTKSAIFTLTSTDIITRRIILPKIKNRDLAGMVEFEIQQYLPIALEDYILQFKCLEDIMDENIKKSKLQVAVLPREIGKLYYDLVDMVDMKPIALDTNANALSKLLTKDTLINGKIPIKEKTIALIDMGYTSMNVSIVSNGIARFNRLISNGSRDLVVNVANVTSMGMDEVNDQILSVESTEDIGDGFIKQVVDGKLNEWLDDIRRVFQFYISRESGNKVDEVYIYGGASDYGALLQVFNRELDVPVNRLNGLSTIRFDKGFSCDVSKYLNAIGSIIRR